MSSVHCVHWRGRVKPEKERCRTQEAPRNGNREYPGTVTNKKDTRKMNKLQRAAWFVLLFLALDEAHAVSAEVHIHQEYDHSPVPSGRPTVEWFLSSATLRSE